MEHDIALLTPTLVACCPPLAARKALTWRGMLSTRVRTLPGWTAAHAWRTVLFSSAKVEVGGGGSGHPCLASKLTFDWSQACSIGFMSGLPHSRRRRLCSKVSLGHLAGRRDQYPVSRSRLRMVGTDIRLPNWRNICFRRRGAEMKQFVWPFGAVDGLPVAWRFSSNLHTSSDVVGQSLGCAAKFVNASLRHAQHPGYFSLRIAICRQPDNSLQYLLWQILRHDPL